MLTHPELDALARRPVVKISVSAVIAGQRFVKVVRLMRVRWAVILLRFVSLERQIAICEPRRDLVRRDSQRSRAAHIPLTAIVVRRPHDCAGSTSG